MAALQSVVFPIPASPSRARIARRTDGAVEETGDRFQFVVATDQTGLRGVHCPTVDLIGRVSTACADVGITPVRAMSWTHAACDC